MTSRTEAITKPSQSDAYSADNGFIATCRKGICRSQHEIEPLTDLDHVRRSLLSLREAMLALKGAMQPRSMPWSRSIDQRA